MRIFEHMALLAALNLCISPLFWASVATMALPHWFYVPLACIGLLTHPFAPSLVGVFTRIFLKNYLFGAA